jgi:hypothetical protein
MAQSCALSADVVDAAVFDDDTFGPMPDVRLLSQSTTVCGLFARTVEKEHGAQQFQNTTGELVIFTAQQVLKMLDVEAEMLEDSNDGYAWVEELFRPALAFLVGENEIMVVGNGITIIPAAAAAQ